MNMGKVALAIALAAITAAVLLLVVPRSASPAFAQAPDEATKAAALKRAYQLNDNSMVGYGRTIDFSNGIPPESSTCHMIEGAYTGQKFFECDQPGQVTADAPAHAGAEIADPNMLNPLDAQAAPDWEARRKFMNRTFRATRSQLAGDVCERHGMHKVVYGDRWRCRK